jgi:hypothetical protein
LKGLIQNPVDSRLGRSSAAKIANTDCYYHVAMDIALFAPLMKLHFFHGVDGAPLLARITNIEFVFGCHCSFPGAVANAKIICIISFERMCELLHTRRLEALALV